MQYLQLYISLSWKKTQILVGSLLLVCGCSIYLLFRSKTIHLYQWFNNLGLIDYIESIRLSVAGSQIPEFVKFSLPDGLYCASYILLMNAIWKGNDKSKSIAVSIIPFAAILHELAQGIGLIRGTFDINDLICYIAPLALYFALQRITNYQQLKKQEL